MKKVFKRIKNFLKDSEKQRFSKMKTGLFAMLGAIAVFIALLFFARWAVGEMQLGVKDFMRRQFISRFVENGAGVGTRLDPDVPDIRDASLVYASFSTTFSGVGWLNQTETTAYQDRVVTAMTFPPRFEWRKISELNVPEAVRKRTGTARPDGSFLKCIDGSCLIRRGNEIFFVSEDFLASYDNERHKVSLPSKYERRNVVKVSVGALQTEWLVGVVEQKGGEYIGRAYYFHPERSGNSAFEEISGLPVFQSRYQGRIGFGGDDGDFLAVYGAYEGQAYHIMDGKGVDISRFFGIRVMDNGFDPVVIKQGEGADSVWYLVSSTSGTPKFLKLFQNGTNNIAGAVDLSKSLFSGGLESALFYPFRENGDLRAVLVDASGNREFWEFEDRGFVKTGEIEVKSVNINNYPAEVRYATIDRLEFSEKGGEVDFYLSNDGEEWIEVDPDEEVKFPNPEKRSLFWRAEIKPDGSAFKAPYIDMLGLQYWVKFL